MKTLLSFVCIMLLGSAVAQDTKTSIKTVFDKALTKFESIKGAEKGSGFESKYKPADFTNAIVMKASDGNYKDRMAFRATYSPTGCAKESDFAKLDGLLSGFDFIDKSSRKRSSPNEGWVSYELLSFSGKGKYKDIVIELKMNTAFGADITMTVYAAK